MRLADGWTCKSCTESQDHGDMQTTVHVFSQGTKYPSKKGKCPACAPYLFHQLSQLPQSCISPCVYLHLTLGLLIPHSILFQLVMASLLQKSTKRAEHAAQPCDMLLSVNSIQDPLFGEVFVDPCTFVHFWCYSVSCGHWK